MKCTAILSHSYLHECFTIKEDSLYWKERPSSHFKTKRAKSIFNKKFANKKAGCLRKDGYLCVIISGRRHLSHRVIWVMTYGFNPEFIDHINGDRSDNRIENLNAVSQKENNRNASMRKDNASGVVGVSWYSRYGKWLVRISNRHVGYYDDFFSACCARKSKENQLGYHQNHGKRS